MARLPLAAALILAAAAGFGPAAAADRVTPSGMAVPRYITLKAKGVNARVGPSEDHRILWIYNTPGLPVQVIAETKMWRKICDPAGRTAWVTSGATSGRRSVIRLAAGALPLRRQPSAKAGVGAWLAPRSLAALHRCKAGWCKLSAGGAEGWAPAAAVWGTDERPQCR